MDIGTLLGLIGAFGVCIAAVLLGANPMGFVDLPSALIVLGGGLGVTIAMFPLKVIGSTIKVIGKCFFYKTDNPRSIIEELVMLSEKARKESIVALEKVQTSNKFLARGIMLVADGTELSTLRGVLDIDIAIMQQRHFRGQEVLKQMGTFFPAFGMIGTLVGLVQMLSNMDDPKSIGPAMAVALLTTLYGAVLANIVCLPLAKKLEERASDEDRNLMLAKEGIISIQKGEHPAILKEKLQSFLPPSMREERK
ncbi:MAG: MotA/TolQ/ExbB proton channel family protein [Deltaproteobacteria bacterium]|jgi:chemotaxis protein MotA|nr:MotA/TolQ/ExbB proton channel family protein [Deltaproteobacteria bacterium]